MGMNYYYHLPGYKKIHIGKSSYGWCFLLHVYPKLGSGDPNFIPEVDGIQSLDDWKGLFSIPHSRITDEYGFHVTPEDILRIITCREGYARDRDGTNESWEKWAMALHPYASEEDFHKKNHSERGPKGLLRFKVGDFCVGHGEGTYDYITGEFS
jgi:hypothetical protein